MEPPKLQIRGIAVLDDDGSFATAVWKALNRGLQENTPIEGVSAALLIDTTLVRTSTEGRLGVLSYLQRLDDVRKAVNALIDKRPTSAQFSPLPHFLFCDVLMPDYEGGGSNTDSLKTAQKIRDLLTVIYRQWKKAFPEGPEFPFRVQFWSEYWERLDRRGADLTVDNSTGMKLEWAHYRTKPAVAADGNLDGEEIRSLFRQILDFRSGWERLPAWVFAGAEGKKLRARIGTLINTPGSCVVVSNSRVARAQAAQEFVAKSGLPIRSIKPFTTLRQLYEWWDLVQDKPGVCVIDLTALEYDDTHSDTTYDLLAWMGSSCRSPDGHRFVHLVEPEDQSWRQVLKRAFGGCELLVPSPGERPSDVPRMVQARCNREIPDSDSNVLKQRAQYLQYEDIDRLTRDDTEQTRDFGAEDWDVLGLRPEELLVLIELSHQGKDISLTCNSKSTELTHVGQKQNVWALLCMFAQERRGTAERLDFSLTEAPSLAAELRAQSPRLWEQESSTQAERRVFDSEGRWQCDFTKDTTGGMTQSLARWFGKIGLRPPRYVGRKDDRIVIEWGYPFAVSLLLSDEMQRSLSRPAPRRPPRPGGERPSEQ